MTNREVDPSTRWGNPPGISFFELLREDYRANSSDWTNLGFRAIAVHRFGNWRMSVEPLALRAPLSVLYRFLFRFVRNRYGIELPYTVRIGRRLAIDHQGGIVVSGYAEFGDDCRIRHNDTFGIRKPGDTGAPRLGNRVDVGAGAVLLGPIEIGDGAVIGANAVVLQDVPAGAIAVGIPAEIRQRGEPALNAAGKPK